MPDAFDAHDPGQALAQETKTVVTLTLMGVMATPAYTGLADPGARFQFMLAGAQTAVCGVMIAHVAPQDHREALAALIAYLPDAFDTARDIAGLPPLPRDN